MVSVLYSPSSLLLRSGRHSGVRSHRGMYVWWAGKVIYVYPWGVYTKKGKNNPDRLTRITCIYGGGGMHKSEVVGTIVGIYPCGKGSYILLMSYGGVWTMGYGWKGRFWSFRLGSGKVMVGKGLLPRICSYVWFGMFGAFWGPEDKVKTGYEYCKWAIPIGSSNCFSLPLCQVFCWNSALKPYLTFFQRCIILWLCAEQWV